MGNMSYCRFENTEHDLRDCFANLPNNDLSKREAVAFADLIMLCKDIADRYSHIDDWHELCDIAVEKYDDDDDIVELERD
jgi:hypothetical protein